MAASYSQAMTEPERDEPDLGERPPRAHDDAAAVGWHGHSDDFEMPAGDWRPVHTVEVRGDLL